jgi:hypothetical protein
MGKDQACAVAAAQAGRTNGGDTALPACSALQPCIDMTKTAQYGPVFSQQADPMERGSPSPWP